MFETSLRAVVEVQQLASKSDRTDAEDARLFLAQLGLGQLSFEDARARRQELSGLSDEQKAEADNEILVLEVDLRMREAGRDRMKAYTAFAEMAKAGRTPRDPRAFNFWYGVMVCAVEQKDVALLESSLKIATEDFGGRRGFDRMTQRFADALAELKKDG